MIRVACECGKRLGFKDEAAGKTVQCPDCRATIWVPIPSIEPLVRVEPEPLAPALGGAPEADPSPRPFWKDPILWAGILLPGSILGWFGWYLYDQNELKRVREQAARIVAESKQAEEGGRLDDALSGFRLAVAMAEPRAAQDEEVRRSLREAARSRDRVEGAIEEREKLRQAEEARRTEAEGRERARLAAIERARLEGERRKQEARSDLDAQIEQEKLRMEARQRMEDRLHALIELAEIAKRNPSIKIDNPDYGFVIRFGLVKLAESREYHGTRYVWWKNLSPEERAGFLLDQVLLCAERGELQEFAWKMSRDQVTETARILSAEVNTENSRKLATLLTSLQGGAYKAAMDMRAKIEASQFAGAFDPINREAMAMADEITTDIDHYIYLLWLRADRGEKWENWWQLGR